ncbi:hypothetical protein GGI43DRAFT_429729 [Trichoderma evansii]
MSPPYDPQDIGDDFANSWVGSAIFDTASSSNLDSSRGLSQSFMSDETESGIYLQALDFLSTVNTRSADPTIHRGSSLEFDRLSNWAAGVKGYPFQNTFVPNNTFFQLESSQHSQPTLPFDQQLLPYNVQHPVVNEESAQDNPFSVYPPLDDGNASNSLPYGRWVIQQSQQNYPLTTLNPNPINASYAMNNQHQPDNTQMEIYQESRRGSEDSFSVPKVSMDRAAKQRKDPKCDPYLLYPPPKTRDAWGSKTWNGQHLFTYTPKGQWLRDRCFNNEQLREYVDNCPKGTVFRVQQAPTQCNHRLDQEDRICRWANCPVGNRTITAGWLRVAFDEFPVETSGGTRDPLKCAGSMHLWCFEQVFDLMEFDLDERLKAEIRQFPFEDRNVTTLEKLTDVGIVRAAYIPWFEKRKAFFNMHGKLPVSRKYEDTLSYTLNKHHLKHQTAARQRARLTRNNNNKRRENKEPNRTIDIHMGNLKTYVALTNKSKKARKVKRLQEMREDEDVANPPAGDMDSSDTSSEIWIAPPLTPKTASISISGQIAPSLPAEASLETPPSCLLQKKRRSPRASNLKGTSARGARHEYKRQAFLPQPSVGKDHDLGINTCCSTAVVNLNTNSTPPSYFDPLNPADRTMKLAIRPSPKIGVLSNIHQGDLANAYNPNCSQPMSGLSFNMGDQTQLSQSLGSLMQCQQQQLFPSITVPSDAKVEQQPVIQGGSLNTPLEVSHGNDLVESYQSKTKSLSPKAREEALKVLGGRDGTSLNDSNQVKGLDPEETNLCQFLTLDEDVPETTQYPIEDNTKAMNSFIAQTQMNADASQPLEPVACTESPQVAALAESWDSLSSFMDPVNYGGYGDTDILTLFEDFAATTDRTNGESRNG